MELYTLTGLHKNCSGRNPLEYMDNPAKIRLDKSSFSLLYLVSRDRLRAQYFADTISNHTNNLLDFQKSLSQSIELRVKPLSIKGQIKFLMRRYLLGNSIDLDTPEEKIKDVIVSSPYRSLISRL